LAKKIVFTVGLSGFALGFLVLGFVDAYGQNWAGMVSPFLIIGGVIAIVVALLLKEE
jgi:succinate-acetate transporter protein